ncbi:DUF393 domain-containing protein [Flaviflexus salsibiostraticola]|uniref:DUF393 domain-containing protein n=2 Tax=Flaviflexus salsibiostraticola TaxID=1282737 RepID=A0A3Q8WU30_9ACTO|nr:DUF393 domain-containing protein [Flaviflexus salsibiostraticola]
MDMTNEHETPGTKSRPICVYDGNCGICTKMARWASRRSPAEFTDHADLSHRGVDDSEYEKYLIFAGETVERGHRAVGAVFKTMPWPWKAAGYVINFRLLTPVAREAYRLVASNRRRIPLWIIPG